MAFHDFTFIIEGIDIEDDNTLDRLFEAGCDDATFSLMKGVTAASFDRERDTYAEAVLSALEDLREGGAQIRRFEPDYLVNGNEIAERSGLTPQAISLFRKGERGSGFPPPCARITTASPLWDWVEVSRWLARNGKISEGGFRHAQVSRTINKCVQIDVCGLSEVRHSVFSELAQPLAA